MIWNILWPLMLIFSVVGLPILLWRQMKSVQRAARDKLDEAPAPDEPHWGETLEAADGLHYGRTQQFDAVLSKASRDAAHVDDIKNLEGRR